MSKQRPRDRTSRIRLAGQRRWGLWAAVAGGSRALAGFGWIWLDFGWISLDPDRSPVEPRRFFLSLSARLLCSISISIVLFPFALFSLSLLSSLLPLSVSLSCSCLVLFCSVLFCSALSCSVRRGVCVCVSFSLSFSSSSLSLPLLTQPASSSPSPTPRPNSTPNLIPSASHPLPFSQASGFLSASTPSSSRCSPCSLLSPPFFLPSIPPVRVRKLPH